MSGRSKTVVLSHIAIKNLIYDLKFRPRDIVVRETYAKT